jgi:hypothetical protein
MIDFLLDENLDIKIENGDFVIGESSAQHIALIFNAKPGEWKETPETGIAIERNFKGLLDRFIDTTIRTQMQADGYKIATLSLTEKGVFIDGYYE